MNTIYFNPYEALGLTENEFKVVAAAYEILSDPQKKMEYDEEHVESMSADKGGGSYPYEHEHPMFYERTTTTTYSNNHANPCRFLDKCNRSDCYFDHPSGEKRTGLTSSPPKKAMAKGRMKSCSHTWCVIEDMVVEYCSKCGANREWDLNTMDWKKSSGDE